VTEQICNVVEPLKSFLVPVEDINLDPANARLHGERNINAVKSSLNTLGQHVPIVVQKEGMIVRVGNARLTAARDLGWSHIAAVVIDESNVEGIARAIADNRASEMSHWDFGVLEEMLNALDTEGWGDTLSTLWTKEELQGFGIDQGEVFDISIVDPNDDGDETFASSPQFSEKHEVIISGEKESFESPEFRVELSEFCEKHQVKYRIR